MSLITATLKRNKNYKDEYRFIYLFFEGVVTEPYFILPFIKYSSFFKDNNNIIFKKIIKLNKDKGVSNIKSMTRVAKKEIVDTLPFNKKYDKVLFIFDLDIYKNNKVNLLSIMDYCLSYYIYAYTNPSIELFLLLTIKDSYLKYIKKNKNKILKNEYDKIDKKRYINHLFYSLTKINSKKDKNKLIALSKNFDIAIEQENKYLNRYIDLADKSLTSNIGYIFKMIKDNKLNEITYYSDENNVNTDITNNN